VLLHPGPPLSHRTRGSNFRRPYLRLKIKIKEPENPARRARVGCPRFEQFRYMSMPGPRGHLRHFSLVQESTIQYRTVSTVQDSTVQCSTVQYSTVQYSTVQYSTVQYSCTVQLYCTVQHSTVQYSTGQYSTGQYSTVQYSTVQYSTVPGTPGALKADVANGVPHRRRQLQHLPCAGVFHGQAKSPLGNSTLGCPQSTVSDNATVSNAVTVTVTIIVAISVTVTAC